MARQATISHQEESRFQSYARAGNDEIVWWRAGSAQVIYKSEWRLVAFDVPNLSQAFSSAHVARLGEVLEFVRGLAEQLLGFGLSSGVVPWIPLSVPKAYRTTTKDDANDDEKS